MSRGGNNAIDLSGQVFGHLTVLRKDGRRSYGQVCWETLCDCGTLHSAPGRELRIGERTSCGCAKGEDPRVRFMRYVNVIGEHWMWTGFVDGDGYGRFWLNGRGMNAHRAGYLMFKGPLNSLDGCHTCDIRDCVNPEHVFPGTQADNNADRDAKNRTSKGERHSLVTRGERHPRARLTEAQVIAIRMRLATGEEWSPIGRDYGLTKSGVFAIKHRRAWRHLP